MNPIDYLFLIGVPVVLIATLAFVLFSGRMSPETRARIEKMLGWVFWPLVTVYWTWRAIEFGLEGEWINMGLMALLAVVFGAQGVTAIRQGRFLPVRKTGAS